MSKSDFLARDLVRLLVLLLGGAVVLGALVNDKISSQSAIQANLAVQKIEEAQTAQLTASRRLDLIQQQSAKQAQIAQAETNYVAASRQLETMRAEATRVAREAAISVAVANIQVYQPRAQSAAEQRFAEEVARFEALQNEVKLTEQIWQRDQRMSPVFTITTGKQSWDYRRALGIPVDFSPDTQNLSFVKIGELEIDAPKRMGFYDTAIVTATLQADRGLLSSGSTFAISGTKDLRVSQILHPRLETIDFETRPSDDAQPQFVSAGEVIRWNWIIRPKNAGKGKPITVRLFSAANDQVEGTSQRLIVIVPGKTELIDVDQTFIDGITGNQFFKDIIIGLLGSSVVAALFTFFFNRKVDERLGQVEKNIEEIRQAADHVSEQPKAILTIHGKDKH